MSVDFTHHAGRRTDPGRRTARVGAQAGARELGASVYELEPGAVDSPLRVHHANFVKPRASRIDALTTAPGDSRGFDPPY
jgi:hypothetical protein